jgi:hypothetical protein
MGGTEVKELVVAHEESDTPAKTIRAINTHLFTTTLLLRPGLGPHSGWEI